MSPEQGHPVSQPAAQSGEYSLDLLLVLTTISPPSYPLGPLRPEAMARWLTLTSDSDHMTTLSYETSDPGCQAGDPSHFVLATWFSQASDPGPVVLHVWSASVAFHTTEIQSNTQVADQQVAAPVKIFRSWNSNH